MFKKFKPLSNETDNGKIRKIFEMYRSMMFYIAEGILEDSTLAEDAVSDSIEKIIQNIDKIKDVSSYRTRGYIAIIVRSVSLDILKKLKAHKISDTETDILENISDESLSVLDEITGHEGYEALVVAIRALPETLRDPMYLSACKHLSYYEVAEELGISYDTVKMRMSRAKKELKKFLRESE